MRIARTTRDRFVASSVYFNMGWLFDRLGDPARAGEILVDEGLPLLAELGLPAVALSRHAGWYLWQAGRWDAGRRGRGGGRPGRPGAQRPQPRPRDDAGDVRGGERRGCRGRTGADPTEDAGPWLVSAERAIWCASPDVAAGRASRGLEAATYAVERGDRSFRGWLLRQQARAQADLAVAAARTRGAEAREAAEASRRRRVERRGSCSARATRRTCTATTSAMNLVLTEAEATRATGFERPRSLDPGDRAAGRGGVGSSSPPMPVTARAEALLAAGGQRAERPTTCAGRSAAARSRWVPRRSSASSLDLRRAPGSRSTRTAVYRSTSDDHDARLPSPLTRREREVSRCSPKGRTNRQIADELFISESTAGVHVSNILGKLGVTGRNGSGRRWRSGRAWSPASPSCTPDRAVDSPAAGQSAAEGGCG